MINNIKGLSTITYDNKNIGKVIDRDSKNFIVRKKFLFSHEEFHVPLKSIVRKSEDGKSIFIALKESELKHGRELIKRHKPSDLVKGKSYPTFTNPFEKEIIKYESFPIYDKYDKYKEISEFQTKYMCDSCSEHFQNKENLNRHRKVKHFGPIGL